MMYNVYLLCGLEEMTGRNKVKLSEFISSIGKGYPTSIFGKWLFGTIFSLGAPDWYHIRTLMLIPEALNIWL